MSSNGRAATLSTHIDSFARAAWISNLSGADVSHRCNAAVYEPAFRPARILDDLTDDPNSGTYESASGLRWHVIPSLLAGETLDPRDDDAGRTLAALRKSNALSARPAHDGRRLGLR